ncbi:hypothetical protein L1987_44483 [Smallanthus sonchifolius]|uniref:Uncharacterized protein n=1 Tax=Smallanthus sonchifolius TaxID=185202 RepID=A0ACB9GQK4_9ASTR|nr:hypothetical protein L1987_44483 [Smallanthus sonchifolius]
MWVPSLEVSSCDHLKYVLSTSMMKGLVQLQELRISSCELVEEVLLKDISVEDQLEVVLLPRMKTLELKGLPNLKSFCSINGILQLSSLQFLKVTNCPMMKIFASFLNQSNLRFGNQVSNEFFGGEILLLMLEKLSIEDLSSSTGPWHNQLPYDSFHQLKKLKVKRCKKLLRLVPKLKDLNKLYVEECDSLGEILGIEQSIGGGYENHLVCMLRDVNLQNLPKLVEIWWNKDLNGILNYPMFSSLKVIKCDGLMKVFSVSVIKHFLHLEELYLANCLVMKEVIADDEWKGYAGENAVFPQLHSLGLVNLPNVTSFCAGVFMVEFPSLEYINLEACPDMRTFSLGPLVAPKLNAIVLENGEQLWKDDLNNTIKHLFMTKE